MLGEQARAVSAHVESLSFDGGTMQIELGGARFCYCPFNFHTARCHFLNSADTDISLLMVLNGVFRFFINKIQIIICA